ncbi:pyridoxal phosphate-dependent transferase [Pelagophyceae sp. CCMP2097]|nr:pyridoxal phosphate-dependent transferase [Pelagophyceae sp. CCMP2097]|mmetsp:Transcript_18842/g.63675  ORF Transcript_18842/g.63675 Transcript_18842/m.63675 type:complete len:416 (-) Transcript_18842:1554-2801(-)
MVLNTALLYSAVIASRSSKALLRRSMTTAMPSPRMIQTDAPVIVTLQKMMKGKEGILSLAQGIVHWAPPVSAVDGALEAISSGVAHKYGADEGIQSLRDALASKLSSENGLNNVDVMVTHGANQAFINVALSLLGENDVAMLFVPFYFNHKMALQMTGAKLELAPMQNLLPDLAFLEAALKRPQGAPKMVTIVNPGNPTGTVVPAALLQRAADLCAAHKCWLVVDNTYESFVYGDAVHACVGGVHVINLFSFSKGYGMMGWRVGYVAYDSAGALGPELLKAQDTIAICATIASQHAAHGALEGAGAKWVADNVAGLSTQKQLVRDALSVLGPDSVSGGDGAIYFFAKLPDTIRDDRAVVKALLDDFKVVVLPGYACGAPGYIRVCYANLTAERCAEAAQRLKTGLEQLLLRAGKA